VTTAPCLRFFWAGSSKPKFFTDASEFCYWWMVYREYLCWWEIGVVSGLLWSRTDTSWTKFMLRMVALLAMKASLLCGFKPNVWGETNLAANVDHRSLEYLVNQPFLHLNKYAGWKLGVNLIHCGWKCLKGKSNTFCVLVTFTFVFQQSVSEM
jgi:hypothetical protein